MRFAKPFKKNYRLNKQNKAYTPKQEPISIQKARMIWLLSFYMLLL